MDIISAPVQKLLDLVPSCQREEARKLITAALAEAEDGGTPKAKANNEALCDGIRDIADSIVVAKAEISDLRLPESKRKSVEEATSELDEIVRTTEEATNQIISSSEEIDRAVSNMRASGVLSQIELEKIQNEYMNIIMACSFQDITGQRIGKVVSALHAIEDKVDELIDLLGIERGESASARKRREKRERPDEDLLHGPVSPGDQAIDQSSIDALFD